MTTEHKYVLDLLINLDNSTTVLNPDVDKKVPYPSFDPAKAMQSYRRIAEVFELKEETFIDYKPPEVSPSDREDSEGSKTSCSKISSPSIQAASTASGLESPDVAEVADEDKAGRKDSMKHPEEGKGHQDKGNANQDKEAMDVDGKSDASGVVQAEEDDVVIVEEKVSDQRLVSSYL